MNLLAILEGWSSTRRIYLYSEIKSLMTLSKNGDEGSKERLLIKMKPLILSSIKRYYNDYFQYDDLIQEGYEVILNCINNYESSKGVRFLGYVRVQLKYHYLAKYNEETILSLNDSINDAGEEFIEYIESEGFGPLDTVLNGEEKEVLSKGLLNLTERQRQIFIYYYIEKKNMVEISEGLGIAYRTVVNTKVKALEELRKFLNKDFYQ